jgi:hypothetical protein
MARFVPLTITSWKRTPGIHWTEGWEGTTAGVEAVAQKRQNPRPFGSPRAIQADCQTHVRYITVHIFSLKMFFFRISRVIWISGSLQLTPWNRDILEKLSVAQLVKKFPHRSWKPNAHYRVQNSLTPVPNLSQINPVHSFPPYFHKIYSNIILPFTLRSSEWSLPFTISDQDFVRISHSPYVLHASPISQFYHLNNIWWRAVIAQPV